jgi:hypothetical protein
MKDEDFFPVYVLENTDAVDASVSDSVKNKLEKLLTKSKDFSDHMLLNKGVIFTRTPTLTSFHNIYDLRRNGEFCTVFLCYSEEGEEMFGVRAPFVLHLGLFSDKLTNDQIHRLNEQKDESAGHAFTYYFINDQIKKLVMLPKKVEDSRESLVKENKVFKVVESDFCIEDLKIIEEALDILLKSMKVGKNSKHLA